MHFAQKHPLLQNILTTAKDVVTWGCLTIPCFSGIAHAQGGIAYFGKDPRYLAEIQGLGMANDARGDAQAGRCTDAITSLMDLGMEANMAIKYADTPESIIRAQLFSDLKFKTLSDVAPFCDVMPTPRQGSFADGLSKRGNEVIELAKSGKCDTARQAANEILASTTAKGVEYNAVASERVRKGLPAYPAFQDTSVSILGNVVGPTIMGICLGDKNEPNKWLDNMVDAINQDGSMQGLAPAINQRLNNQGRSPN